MQVIALSRLSHTSVLPSSSSCHPVAYTHCYHLAVVGGGCDSKAGSTKQAGAELLSKKGSLRGDTVKG